MDPEVNLKITALLSSEPRLEKVIRKLTEKTVAQHDISVQDAPQKIKNTFGVGAIDSEILQHNDNTPTKEPFLSDDWNWLIGFAFSIPLFIGLILGIFVIGDVRILADNLIFGFLGAVVGSAVGLFCAKMVKKIHAQKNSFQQKNGGYLLWVTVTKSEKIAEVMNILETHGAENISIEK